MGRLLRCCWAVDLLVVMSWAGGERALEKREGRREIPAAFGVLALSW
jgi:hypothetical protein